MIKTYLIVRLLFTLIVITAAVLVASHFLPKMIDMYDGIRDALSIADSGVENADKLIATSELGQVPATNGNFRLGGGEHGSTG